MDGLGSKKAYNRRWWLFKKNLKVEKTVVIKYL